MLYGFKSKGNTQVSFYIRIDGYPERGYTYYSFRDALKLYREEFGLVGKHIKWLGGF